MQWTRWRCWGDSIKALKRAKALLGTLVEISVNGDNELLLLAATDAAFARIENIHRAMSFHEQTSDLQAIARCCAGECVVVDQDTSSVLQLALHVEHDSEGIFNPTIAPTLVRRGLLPRPSCAGSIPNPSTLASSIRVETALVVRVLRPVWIDLGGIAKGYAVDAATQVLIDHGVNTGVVNAGGDLRVFGDTGQPIHLRHPSNPGEQIPIAILQELSCATSGDYFVASSGADAAQTAVIGVRATGAETQASITVIAPLCAVADALTKVLWIAGIDSAISRALLSNYEAQAVALDTDGVSTYA